MQRRACAELKAFPTAISSEKRGALRGNQRARFATLFDTYTMSNISILFLTPAQLRAAHALIGIDQRTPAEVAEVSLPTNSTRGNREQWLRVRRR